VAVVSGGNIESEEIRRAGPLALLLLRPPIAFETRAAPRPLRSNAIRSLFRRDRPSREALKVDVENVQLVLR